MEMPESEGDYNQFKEPEGSEFHESKENNADKEENVPNQVHQFYFVKFRPYQDPNSTSKITKAERLIRKLSDDQRRITLKLEEIQSYKSNGLWRIRAINLADSRLGQSLSEKRRKLKRLQASLDKLCFANKAYQAKSSDHHLKQKMKHGCKSLAEERKVIREIEASQRRGDDHICIPNSSLENLDYLIFCKYGTIMNFYGVSEDQKELLRKEIKQLEWESDRAITNAAPKGKIWNSFGSKKLIQDQVEIISNQIIVLVKEQLEVRAKCDYIEKKMERNEKLQDSLQKQWGDMRDRKKEACELILRLRKQHGEENQCYYENCLLLKKARQLAKNKDIEALEKLSHCEVEKFMSKWSKSEPFRDEYKKRVLPSLSSQHLSRDERSINLGDLPHTLITPTTNKNEKSFSNKELIFLIKDVKPPPTPYYC